MTKQKEIEYIRFKCRLCSGPLEVDVDMMGNEVECPHCRKMIRVPMHTFTINPFRRPIGKFVSDIAEIQWQLPYFPQIIEVGVLLLVISVTTILYLTVGIASQIEGIFHSLTLDARNQIKTGSLIERSAYAVSAGIYLTLWLPFLVLLLPFSILGWLWNHLSYFGLMIIVVIVALIYVYTSHPDALKNLLTPMSAPINLKAEPSTTPSVNNNEKSNQ